MSILFLTWSSITNKMVTVPFWLSTKNQQLYEKFLICVCAEKFKTQWYRRRVWRYQRGNQNLYIEAEQTTQWPKEKVQNDKQRSTKHTHKTKDRVTRTPLKTGGELRCSGRVSSSCSTSGNRHVNLVTNPVISHEWRKGSGSVYDKWNISMVICDTYIP